ncbi:MAG: hypothetical protein HY719_16630 [Planctomycetes bacterium]|nr:hypothetical protein [Planctomycetota bacterium]
MSIRPLPRRSPAPPMLLAAAVAILLAAGCAGARERSLEAIAVADAGPIPPASAPLRVGVMPVEWRRGGAPPGEGATVFDEAILFEVQEGLVAAAAALPGVYDARIVRGPTADFDVVLAAVVRDGAISSPGGNGRKWPNVAFHTVARFAAWWVPDIDYEMTFTVSLTLATPQPAGGEAAGGAATEKTRLGFETRTTGAAGLSHLDRCGSPGWHVVGLVVPPCFLPDEEPARVARALAPAAWREPLLRAFREWRASRAPATPTPPPAAPPDPQPPASPAPPVLSAPRPPEPLATPALTAPRPPTPNTQHPTPIPAGSQPSAPAPPPVLIACPGTDFAVDVAGLPRTLRAEVVKSRPGDVTGGAAWALRISAVGDNVFIRRVGTAHQTYWPLRASGEAGRPPERKVYLLPLTKEELQPGRTWFVEESGGAQGAIRVVAQGGDGAPRARE